MNDHPPPPSPPGPFNLNPHRADNCPFVTNPYQGAYFCNLNVPGFVCNAACATGCTDNTGMADKCTTPVSKKGKLLPCKRCKSGFHPVGAFQCVVDTPGQAYNCKIVV